MGPTGELREEHGAVKAMLAILGKACDRMEAGGAVPLRHLEGILEFLRVFVDTCHHGKEEEHLFPAMEAAGVPRAGGPIGRMLLEHDEGRALVRALGAAAARHGEGDPAGTAAFVAAARKYTALLLAHIDKEDHVLYPLADGRLPEETQAELSAAFVRLEEERVGRGRHEAFHAMLERLGREYGA